MSEKLIKPELLYLAPQNPYPPVDGGKIGIYYPLKYLSEYFNITFIFPVQPDTENYALENTLRHFASIGVRAVPVKHDTKNDYKHVFINFFKKLPFKWEKYYSQKILSIIKDIVIKKRIYYILVSSPHMAKYAVYFKNNPGIRLFLREHNIEFSLVEQFINFTGNPLYKSVGKWQLIKTKKSEQNFWNLFDKIFFISDLDLKTALSINPGLKSKFELLYDGYEIKFFENNSYDKLIKGFLYPANLQTLQNEISFKWFLNKIWIPSIEIIKMYGLKLYITGNQNIKWEKYLGKKDAGNYEIINLGFVDDIDKEIMKYKYVLAPTIIGSGIRLKILNGMACGKVVFASSLDLSTSEKFKDMHNIVAFNSKNDFIEKVKFLEESPDQIKYIGNKAKETIGDFFSWKEYAIKLYNIITYCS